MSANEMASLDEAWKQWREEYLAVVRVAHLRKHKQVERKNEELTGHGDPLPVFLHTVGIRGLRGASEAGILASGLVRNFVRMGIEDA